MHTRRSLIVASQPKGHGADSNPKKIEYKFSEMEEVTPGRFSFTLTVTAPEDAAHYLAGIRMVLQRDFGVPVD
jgi:hypothetical protein